MSIQNGKAISVFSIPFRRSLKLCGLVTFVALASMWFIYSLDIRLPSQLYQCFSENRTETYVKTKKKAEVKTILFWTEMWNNKTFYLGTGDIFEGCGVYACRATNNRSLKEIEDFDALLFHGIQIAGYGLPPTRSMKQKYIFVDVESPVTYPLNSVTTLNKFYNWTMTYRRDSDILMPYGHFFDAVTKNIVYPLWARTVANHMTYENLSSFRSNITFKGKMKTAAWFVSHCGTAGQRDTYVAELKKYIDIDIYGKCGPKKCPNNDKKCYEMLESNYYFYLSFENSLCQDYVTEKLYEVMKYNVVPIVYGGANYTDFAPPGSYINVADFESPKYLAEHLRYLMSNPEEYAKFFWWKEYFTIEVDFRQTACQMCKMLHDEKTLAPSVVTDLKKWWVEEKCMEPTDFLKKVNRAIE